MGSCINSSNFKPNLIVKFSSLIITVLKDYRENRSLYRAQACLHMMTELLLRNNRPVGASLPVPSAETGDLTFICQVRFTPT